MPTDYSLIVEENIKRYGTDIDDYGPVLLSNRYSDRTHFVYELLQNAEDAIGWRMSEGVNFPRDVFFELREQELVFRHSGLPFSEKHVRAICSIGKGTKQEDLTAIGRFGIGFKSVFAYTNHPEVHSGDEHFLIESYVRPAAIFARPVPVGETQFYLPFDNPEVQTEAAYNEIAERLQALGLRTLLFLRNIDSINWTLTCGSTGQYLRESKSLGEGIDRVTLLGQGSDGEEAEEQWIVFRKPVANVGKPAGFIEVAFRLVQDEKTKQIGITAIPESPLAVFFPTEKETHFGFLLQGPYRTTPSRDNIPRDDPWNKFLVAETVDMLTWALGQMRELKLMNVGALEALTVEISKFDTGSHTAMFRPIAEAIVTKLQNDPLIPSNRGTYLSGKSACIARADSLRSLFSYGQLSEVTGTKSGWVTSEITLHRTPGLRKFLVESVGVREFDGDNLIRELSDKFLREQSDEWTAEFYAFLLDQQAVRRQWWFSGKALIRLRTNKHVIPFTPDGTPNAYLPGAGQSEYPTVKKSLCEGDALKLLVQLGLKPPDPVDDVVRNVLPKYRQDEVDVDDATYDADIRRILDAFATDSKGQREKLIKALQDTFFVMASDAGDGKKYVSKPQQLYLATERLKTLFAGVQDVLIVDDDYDCLRGEEVRELLEACGASRHIRAIPDNTLSSTELYELRQQSGYVSSSFINDRVADWSLDCLDRLLAVLPALSQSECAGKAKLLWEELAHLEERRGKGVFIGEYTWTHHGQRRAPSFDAAFIRILNSTPWIPTDSGELQKPELVLFDQLGWKANPFLQSKIRFKPPVIEALAKELGIEPGALDLLKKLGLTSEAELRLRLGVGEDVAAYGDGASQYGKQLDKHQVEEVSREDVSNNYAGNVEDANDGILGHATDTAFPVNAQAQSKSIVSTAKSLSSGNGTHANSSESGAVETGSTEGKYNRSNNSDNGKGRAESGSSAGARQFISYLATHPNDEEPDPDGLEQKARMDLEELAIQYILSVEPQLKRTPLNNPGFDLYSGDTASGFIRKVEVKAMSRDLLSRPVGLSHTQFECAQREGRAYWLYVVEYAGDPNRSRMIRIQDPAGKARTFTLDHGWISVAEVVGSN